MVLCYGMPVVAKLFTAMGDSYFKTNSSFLHNRVGFHWTDSISCFTAIALTEPIRFFFFTEHQFDYFTVPTRFFVSKLIRFLLNRVDFFSFSMIRWTELHYFIKQGTCPQLAILSCKRTRGFTYLRLLRVNHQSEHKAKKKQKKKQ